MSYDISCDTMMYMLCSMIIFFNKDNIFLEIKKFFYRF